MLLGRKGTLSAGQLKNHWKKAITTWCRKLAYWEASGLDGLQRFFSKNLTSLNGRIAQQMGNMINKRQGTFLLKDSINRNEVATSNQSRVFHICGIY